jgi:hypothetical protein
MIGAALFMVVLQTVILAFGTNTASAAAPWRR